MGALPPPCPPLFTLRVVSSSVVQKLFSQPSVLLQEEVLSNSAGFGVSLEVVNSGSSYVAILDQN